MLLQQRVKNEPKGSHHWLNRASELLDLSSSDNRGGSGDTPTTSASDEFAASGQGQQGGQGGSGQGGFIPQIVMNPWDPNQVRDAYFFFFGAVILMTMDSNGAQHDFACVRTYSIIRSWSSLFNGWPKFDNLVASTVSDN